MNACILTSVHIYVQCITSPKHMRSHAAVVTGPNELWKDLREWGNKPIIETSLNIKTWIVINQINKQLSYYELESWQNVYAVWDNIIIYYSISGGLIFRARALEIERERKSDSWAGNFLEMCGNPQEMKYIIHTHTFMHTLHAWTCIQKGYDTFACIW